MTDFRKNFVHVFKDRNYLFWGSFVIGLAWQLFVVYTLGVTDIFQVVSLVGYDFAWVFGLGITPWIVHEIVVCALFLKRSYRVKVVNKKGVPGEWRPLLSLKAVEAPLLASFDNKEDLDFGLQVLRAGLQQGFPRHEARHEILEPIPFADDVEVVAFRGLGIADLGHLFGLDGFLLFKGEVVMGLGDEFGIKRSRA